MSHRLSGRPLHHDRHELHGVTVVLDTRSAETYVGRFDSQDQRGVHLFDVGVFDPAHGTRDDYVRRSAKFGIRVDRPQLTIDASDVAVITPLGQIEL
ncbi:MAG TPA: hypothetical protein VJQ44_02135 [Gemmatimonadales bacterium]|nr:hypothetical protein [Gemmatimonadales bacterium]